ncbi:PREDICTED: glutathione S-transferase T3-like [Camelina sativa]|uniref:Glutathione S-transferase T3-like n=1 Tax=Camelina sativa TaxID=90675 RepID=A0ABM0V5D5_CAMSA|nr:PREDICTED: glutathione S-transferase T3-like [Camelina sativa]XP_010495774.1 PREDICTED: glutathione S-transferase T3-like [Camelina sativa]
MDSTNPFFQSSSYLNLLNSQEEGGLNENFRWESYPPSGQSSQPSPYSSQPSPQSSQPSPHSSQPSPHSSQETPLERKERKTWTPADDEVLISAWLNTSKDAIVANQQKGGSFWQRIQKYYADTPHARNGGEQMLVTHCKQRWHKINDQTNKFCAAFAAAERQNSSGHSENDIMINAHDIYFADHKKRFNLEHCWFRLRFEQKFLSLNTINTLPSQPATKRKQAAEGSQSSSSNVDDHEKRPEGIKAAKAKRNNAQSTNVKTLAEYKSMWDVKKEELAEKEKLQKLAILDTLLAKKEPLSASEEIIMNKIVSQYF